MFEDRVMGRTCIRRLKIVCFWAILSVASVFIAGGAQAQTWLGEFPSNERVIADMTHADAREAAAKHAAAFFHPL